MHDVAQWLTDLDLPDYAQAFADHDIDAELLPDLTDADLQAVGVASLGHRKRLLKAIAHLSGRGSDSGTTERTEKAERTGRAELSAAASSAGTARPEAERRQLTVMFCDLVASTELSGRLDPEDYRLVIGTYHKAVATVVQGLDGHVAQYLGDGVLAYFGYPRAHEDDAVRAVRAALGAIDAVQALRPLGALILQTRIGVASGPVVVGEIGSGTPGAELSASGETPNLAARLQGHAGPGEIVLSGDTRKLIGGSFDLQPLGRLALKGTAHGVDAWRVVGERAVASRFEAQHAQDLARFVGREPELDLILQRWTMAREGEGQVVLLTGEAGIGKSRIAQTLRERLSGEPLITVLLQCSPYHTGSSLHPVAQALERMGGILPTDGPEARIGKIEQRLKHIGADLPSASMGVLLRVLGLFDGAPIPTSRSPQQEKTQTLHALIEVLQALARDTPLLLLVEDAHWIDPTTEDLLALAVDRLRESPTLVLITARPDYLPTWGNPSHLTRLALSRLGQRDCAALVESVSSGKPLPPEVLAEIVRKTDGIPLFVEELTKTVIESGLLEDTPTGYRLAGPLPALAIPSTLQDSLMARLDKLAPAKEIAQVGAVIGREFPHALLAAVLSMSDHTLSNALEELVRSELVLRRGLPPDATYSFKHALIRDTAYTSMLKAQRIVRHGQIAAALERRSPGIEAAPPELLAYHHQQAGSLGAAFERWIEAGDLATRRAAGREAIAHYTEALSLLPSLAEGGYGEQSWPVMDKRSTELDLRLKLGRMYLFLDGNASTAALRNYERARDLAMVLGDLDLRAAACGEVAACWNGMGRYADVIALIDALIRDGDAALRPMNRMSLYLRRGIAKTLSGEFAGGREDLDAARRERDAMPAPDRQLMSGADGLISILMYQSYGRLIEGFPERAEALIREASAISERSDHLPTKIWARHVVASAAARRMDHDRALAIAADVQAKARQIGFRIIEVGAGIRHAIASIGLGQVDQGLQELREAMRVRRGIAGCHCATMLASESADALICAGQHQEALALVLEGEQIQSECDERFYAAELVRLASRIAEVQGELDAAQVGYRRAISIATGQGARLLELRAATDLAAQLARQGREAEGLAILRPIYEWFTEGFDFPDLVRARALLGTPSDPTPAS